MLVATVNIIFGGELEMGLALLETTAVTMKRVRPEFGQMVKAVLTGRGLSLRAARIRTGIDHVTLSDMAAGYVPRLEQVERFARGFGFDVNEWRVLAGFDPVEVAPPPQAVESCAYLIRSAIRDRPEEVREAVSLIVAEARAAYDAPPQPTPYPFRVPADLPPTPYRDKFLSLVAEKWQALLAAGWRNLPEPFAGYSSGGWRFPTEEAAQGEFLGWLERAHLANPDRATPEELRRK